MKDAILHPEHARAEMERQKKNRNRAKRATAHDTEELQKQVVRSSKSQRDAIARLQKRVDEHVGRTNGPI